MTIDASNLPGLPCRIILTRGTSPAQYWNRTAGAFEARNAAHAADYAWAMTAGTVPDERGYVVYSHAGVFAGVPDGAIVATCLDGTGGLDADEPLAFASATGTVVSGVFASLVVGKYLTQDYMEQVRGAENIRVWSRKSEDVTTTDVAAVQAAIDNAENFIDSQLKFRYPIPLTAPDGVSAITNADLVTLRNIAEPIATYELYLGRPGSVPNDERNTLSDQRKAALARLATYVAGTVYLDAPTSFTAGRAPEVVR